MLTLEEIPPFRGDLSPNDASNWLKTFVTATGSFSDAGIFRFLYTKFEVGTIARKWYNELEAATKQTWPAFEQEFRTRWIAIPLEEAEKEAAWDEFCNHKLTYEMIFTRDHPDFTQCRPVVHHWVEEHARLGGATNHEEVDLVQKTLTILPSFIQAFLESYLDYDTSPPTSMDELSQQLKKMGTKFFKFEWLRTQKSSSRTLEVGLRDLMGKVDKVLNTFGHQRSGAVDTSIPQSQQNSDSVTHGSVAWEPCSPLTSVISMSEDSEANESQGVATPTAEQRSLPDATELTPEETSSIAPRHWRKPRNLFKKKDRIAIADRALNVMLEYESIIKGNQAAMMNSSFAIFAYLTGQQSRIRDSKALLPKPENHPETLWYSIEMMYRYQVTTHRLTLYQCKEEWRTLLRTPGYHNTGSCFVSPDKYWADNSGWSPPTVPFYRRQSTEATFAGGIIKTFHYHNDYRVFSNQTVQFMALSSYLADHTEDPDFLKYALLSAACIKNHMLDSHTNLVLDCVIDAMKGTVKEGGSVSWALTGMCIEGLSVLASVTGDDTWRSLALSMAESAMNLRGSHDASGIFSVGSNSILHENDDLKAQKGLLNRGLLVAYQRNPSNKSFRDLVRSYINVQYNALLDLASFGDSYGVNWGGPYVGPYPHGQLAALDTLIAAIGVND